MKLSKEMILEIYETPIFPLIERAQVVHKNNHHLYEIQVNSLISIKTGGCAEDCAYCPQAARYQKETGLVSEPLLSVETVKNFAQKAKEGGSQRVCLGAAWRQIKDNQDFEQVLLMVKEVSSMGMEVCCTLGMATDSQLARLKEAGLYAYNHNLDTSENFYGEVIKTRTYDDRLKTLDRARKNHLTICSGGIIGLGETKEDRIGLLESLSSLDPYPESVPINALVAVPGTPLENQKRVSVWEMIRMIATTRIVMPKTMVRLSAGRLEMPLAEQALCFLAGANSIFAGEKLLTTPNPSFNQDKEMFELFGLYPKGQN